MSYSYDRFLRPLTESDKSIKILDNSNIVKYTIDPFAIINLLVSNNIIRINLRSQKVILIDFNSRNEATLALSRLQQQVDFLTNKVPTQVDKEVVKYVQSVFDQVSIIVGPTGVTGPQGEIGPTGATGMADTYSATSSTTLSVPQVGQYVILETQNNLSYYTAQNVSVYSDLPNLYNQDYEFDGGYFVGQIDYYNSNTGELAIVTDYSEGSGTFSFWYINLSGKPGLQGIQGPTGATGPQGIQGPTGATGSVLQDIFYNVGGTASATNSTSSIYRTGSFNIGSATMSNSRFVVSGSDYTLAGFGIVPGTVSLVVDNNGNVYNRSKGLDNIAYGLDALRLNSSNSNTAFGHYSLQSNIIGSNNTGIGNSTLASNTTGLGNVAIGQGNLSSNTTGSTNIAIGLNSLSLNTTGNGNIAIGYTTLFEYGVTASFNIAIGDGAGMRTATDGNVAIGYQASQYNRQGSRNTAVGFQASWFHQTGLQNTSFGYSALSGNFSPGGVIVGSSYNTGIGYQSLAALSRNTIYNTAIGHNSGLYIGLTTSYATASNWSTYIGANTRSYEYNSVNEVVIGASAVGYGSNTVTLGNDLITKTILKGNIGIGTATPSNNLHIVGSLTLNDGTQQAGYYLTTDANGNSSWGPVIGITGATGPQGEIGPQGATGSVGPTGSQYYSFSDITSSVISGTYTVTNNDFLKTLVYTGTASINLLLTSSLTFVEGASITLLQKSSGQITVVGSGVVISTTSDVVATTYGANSLADILVYSASSPEVIVSGKLKFA